MSHRSFEDVIVGEAIDCGTVSVTRSEIVAFAERHDPLGIHTDPEAAADSPFDGVIASGIHTLALTQPPVVEHFYGDSDLVAAGRIESLRFPAPVRPGDALSVELSVLEKRAASGADDRGVVRTRRTASVGEEPVLEMRNDTVWRR